jgi:hypothetical protein
VRFQPILAILELTKVPKVGVYSIPGSVHRADRLLLYWTSEPRKEDALMSLPYDPERVEEAGRHFDETVRCIQAERFEVTTPPEAAICKECDLRTLCGSEGVIRRSEVFA